MSNKGTIKVNIVTDSTLKLCMTKPAAIKEKLFYNSVRYFFSERDQEINHYFSLFYDICL